MQIKYYSESEREAWKAWVDEHPFTTFYHRIEWKDILEKSFNHKTLYLMAVENDRIEGILPLIQVKSLLFGNIICSMPFLNFGGIASNNKKAHFALIQECKKIVTTLNAEYIELRHQEKSPADLNRNEHKVSLTVRLDPDPEKIWMSYSGKHRHNVRRSMKNDLTIVRGANDCLDDFYNIIAVGWHFHGTPIYNKKFFQNIIDALKKSIDIYVVYHQGTPIAAAFNGLFRDTVEGMWTYSLREYSKLNANYYLYWYMIKDACKRGYKLFHLGRSSTSGGSVFFKKKWNADPQKLYWEYILNEKKTDSIPQLNVENPKYQLAINTWKKLPLTVTNTIGPFIAKYIP